MVKPTHMNNPKPRTVEVHEVTCPDCHMEVEFTEIYEFCPNCLHALT